MKGGHPSFFANPENAEGYALDFVRRNSVQLSRWQYKNPYGVSGDKTKKFFIKSADLHADKPILHILAEAASKWTAYNSEEILHQYVTAFQSDNSLDEYKDFTEADNNFRERTGAAWDIEVVGSWDLDFNKKETIESHWG